MDLARQKHNAYMRVWNARNREKVRAIKRKSFAKIPRKARTETYQRELDINAKWREQNREKHRAMIRAWKARNKGKLAESVAFRWARKQRATPRWLSKTHREEMRRLYEIASIISAQDGIKYHVDHIVPLRGKIVSGLHVPWNLQILEATANMSKSNRLVV